MTKGEDPLMCACGSHSAVFVPASKKKKSCWMVLSANAGHKPQPITTLAKKDKALERVKAVCAAKSIRPLSSFAEVKTLDGSVTMKSHFFANCGQVGYIQVREIACLTCVGCREHKYGQCKEIPFCGGLLTKPVQLQSGGRDENVETRHCLRLQSAGRELPSQVQSGMMVGSECTNETEPYIVSLALNAQKVWEGEMGRSWMGTITAGDKYILARKLIKGATDLMYYTSGRE